MIDAYLEVLELDYFEVTEAFKELADENVWKRPAPGLLCVGELAGHVAYWEAVRLAGEDGENGEPDLSKCRIQSPLIDRRFAYYPLTLATPPAEVHLAMTAQQVCNELLRVHAEAVAPFKASSPQADAAVPGWPSDCTYGDFLKYAVFHLAYHTGQVYSARHLLGEQTPDN